MKNRKLGTLLANDDAGCGNVKLDQWFLDETALMRADVLNDVIYELQKHYRKALSDMMQEFMSARAAREKEGKL